MDINIDTIIWAVVVLMVVGVMASLAFVFLPDLIAKLRAMKPNGLDMDDQADEIAPEINTMLRNVEQVLNTMQKRGAKAQTLVADAQMYTGLLVGYIQGFMLKVEEFRTDKRGYQEALTALASGDELHMAQAAGSLKDPNLCRLLLTPITDPSIRFGMQKVLATEIGTLTQWEQTYLTFSERLLVDIASYRKRIGDIKATMELYAVAEPLARVENNLLRAQGYLQLTRNVDDANAVRQLPTVSTRALLGG